MQEQVTEMPCPHCNTVLEISPTMWGQTWACPSCESEFELPESATPSAAQEPTPPPLGAEVLEEQKTITLSRSEIATVRKRANEITKRAAEAEQKKADGGFFGPEKKGIEKGVLGGVLMIVIALVWFFAGLAAGYVFYYPPILLIIGIYSVIKGLATGNISGKQKRTER